MKRSIVRILALLLWATGGSAYAETVALQFELNDQQAQYAAARLATALQQRGHSVTQGNARGGFRIALALDRSALKPDAFAVTPGARTVTINGGDGRGLIYGAMSVAEKLRNGTSLTQLRRDQGAAAMPFRAIKFNLPWDSVRARRSASTTTPSETSSTGSPSST